MDNEVSNTFYEVQAEKFYQKKVEVARGVIELGQILIDTKEGLQHGQWLKWLEDSRVGFTDSTARKYMKIARDPQIVHGVNVLDNLSLRRLYTLASAPEEVKEDVANSKDKEEAEKKIKEYERKLAEIKKEKDREIQKLKDELDNYRDEEENRILKKVEETKSSYDNLLFQYEEEKKSLIEKYTNLRDSIEELVREGREEEAKKYSRQMDDLNDNIENLQNRLDNFKKQYDTLNKYNITRDELEAESMRIEIERTHIESEGCAIDNLKDVQDKVNDILLSLATLKNTKCYKNDIETFYNNSCIEIFNLVIERVSEMRNELVDDKSNIYSDIVEGGGFTVE